jgi:hypothetical protein
METSTRIFLMSRDSIYDFVLSITTSNVAWWDKNVKSTFQRKESSAETCPNEKEFLRD